jgi:sortase A
VRARRGLVTAAVVLAAAGAWQLAEAAWIPLKARLAQHLLHRAWTRAQAGEAEARPWPWADTWAVARLRVPAHGVDHIVLAGVSGRTLAFGPGHVATTPLPGAPGTAILGGHRDTHFRFLERLRPGDEIVVEVPGRPPARFAVAAARVVDARTAIVASAAPAAALALVTCYPFDAIVPGGPLRYVVISDGATISEGARGAPSDGRPASLAAR